MAHEFEIKVYQEGRWLWNWTVTELDEQVKPLLDRGDPGPLQMQTRGVGYLTKWNALRQARKHCRKKLLSCGYAAQVHVEKYPPILRDRVEYFGA